MGQTKDIFPQNHFEIGEFPVLGVDKRVRYVDLINETVAARATVWETREAELEALDSATGEVLLSKSVKIDEHQLEDTQDCRLRQIIRHSAIQPKENAPDDSFAWVQRIVEYARRFVKRHVQ
ncbi:hypothetical protein [Desulfatibacillum aliphaticivorans]|uniref:hypothetical protein n=1 Tax=Desulfatibacillum aliphaticivorans TaxID=218208 RepID=UPI0001601151|nr:hypothetical protein [Desulfatibacillum aliphaticivorans]